MEPKVRIASPTVLQKPSKKLEWVAALRGIAILGVILSHTYYLAVAGRGESAQPWPKMHHLLVNFINNGQRGVQLFFVASAFTLFLSHDNRKDEKNPTLNYFLRRFFRIAPLYYCGLIYYSLWHHYVDNITATPGQLVANIFFVHGFSPHVINLLVPGGWSITVEMMFYCLVPLLAVRIRSVNSAIWFIVGALWFNSFMQFFLTKMHISTGDELNRFRSFWLPHQLPIFGLGFLLYFLYKEGRSSIIRPVTSLACAITIILGYNFVNTEIIPFDEQFLFSIGFVFLALALSKHAYIFLVNRITTFVGEISFSLYLAHFGVLYLAQHLNLINIITPTNTLAAAINFALRFVLVVAFSSLVAYITYRVIELPFQKMGKKVIARLER